MRDYGHVLDELEDAPRLPAEEAIRQARDALRDSGCVRLVSAR